MKSDFKEQTIYSDKSSAFFCLQTGTLYFLSFSSECTSCRGKITAHGVTSCCQCGDNWNFWHVRLNEIIFCARLLEKNVSFQKIL